MAKYTEALIDLPGDYLIARDEIVGIGPLTRVLNSFQCFLYLKSAPAVQLQFRVVSKEGDTRPDHTVAEEIRQQIIELVFKRFEAFGYTEQPGQVAHLPTE